MTRKRDKIVEGFFEEEVLSVFGRSIAFEGRLSTEFDELKKKLDSDLKDLREKELKLFSDEVEGAFAGKSEDERKKFDQYRAELSITREKLETEIFAKIAGRFKTLSGELEKGIEALKVDIESVKKTTQFFETLARVVGIIARILVL
ncbi:MAG: hypothetical protein KME45_26825 [Stenomitos rutilans HA7619-LM2]|jgi:Skp family chaperone for outer membrane proteins|nr:hypothetical protein [Stenomitos rutilans HA7619-LM2]